MTSNHETSHHLTQESTPRYQYTPLGQEQKIRLVTLSPRIESVQIHVSLSIEVLTEEIVPEYEALSYTWGSPEHRADIFVNDSQSLTLSVTSNLAIALRFLRYEDRPRTLWIDALCINQQDLDERSAQVQRMGDIYSKASRVIVWLGPESQDSPMAIDCIETINRHIVVDWYRLEMHPISAEVHWADWEERLHFSKAQHAAIGNFFARSWFQRLWIWQEVHLASHEILVTVGTRTLSWDSLCTAIFGFHAKTSELDDFNILLRDSVDRAFTLCQDFGNRPLPTLIDDTKDSLCSDPKDRIFALLSLLPPTETNLGIIPNYAESVAVVYKDAMVRWTQKMGNLRLLKDVEMFESPERVPSWVPDWSTKRTTKPIVITQASPLFPKACFTCQNQVLSASGVSVATIDFVERFGNQDSDRLPGVEYDLGPEVRRMACMTEFQDLTACSNMRLSNLFQMISSLEYGEFEFFGDFSLAALRQYEEAVRACSKAVGTGDDRELSEQEIRHCNNAYGFCWNRSLFRTKEGNIGLAPSTAAVGDQVVVLINCSSPMILRPKGENKFQVIGEACYHGFMDCEVFLGPVPSSLRQIAHYAGEESYLQWAHFDANSGGVYIEDPRLGPLPPNWTRRGHLQEAQYLNAETTQKLIDFREISYPTFVNGETGEVMTGGADPRISIEAFEARGVKFQTFNLV